MFKNIAKQVIGSVGRFYEKNEGLIDVVAILVVASLIVNGRKN